MTRLSRSIPIALTALLAGATIAGSAASASAPPAPPESTTAPTTTAATTTAAPITTEAEVLTHPLIGVPVEDPDNYTPRPALVVKVDNGVNSKPQSGLNEADIVFEEIVEGRVTRFAVVFNSRDAEQVGNIRSGRTQDVDLFSSFNDPIFAFSGGNAGVNAALAATGWQLLTQGDGMYRVSGRGGAPYNLFGNTEEFFARAGDSGDAVPQFEYGPMDGDAVTGFDLSIGSISVAWNWDAEQGLFIRSERGNVHETTTGPVSTNNVVVLFLAYGTSPADGNSPEAQSTGSGRVVVFRDGVRIDGEWARESNTEPFTLTTDDGEPLLLTPGRTFVELADEADNDVTNH